MFAKFKLAAAVLAAALAFVPLSASAKTTVHVGIGGGWGYPGWGHGGQCWNTHYGRCGWGYYHYRPYYYRPYVNYYYNPYPAYGYPPPVAAYRVSCGAAKSIVYRSGYGHVSVVDCGGKYHVFNATRHGHYYRLRVSAWNGGLVVVARN